MTHILMAVTTAPIGNSSSVKGGIAVVTLGNAQGRGTITVTAGQVTVLKHTITVSNEGGSTASGTLDGMIQANADVAPGDSGRPLLGMSTCSVCTLRAPSTLSGRSRCRAQSARQIGTTPKRSRSGIDERADRRRSGSCSRAKNLPLP